MMQRNIFNRRSDRELIGLVPIILLTPILLGIICRSAIFTQHHFPLNLLETAELRASLEMSRDRHV